MDQTEPQPTPDRARRGLPWLTLALLAVLASLFISTYVATHSEGATETSASAGLVLNALTSARQYHLAEGLRTSRWQPNRQPDRRPAQRRPRDEHADDLVLNMRRIATVERTSKAWRQLAIVQAMVGDPEWPRSVERIPGGAPDEVAFWQTALSDERIPKERVPALLARLQSMDLGWYRRPAAERVYRSARLHDEADQEANEADRGMVLLAALGLCGSFLCFAAVAGAVMYGLLLFARRKDPSVVLPRCMDFAPPPRLTQEKASVLYTGFIVYLCALLVVRYARMALARLFPVLTHLAPGASVAASLPFLLLVLAAPIVVIWLLGRRVGLRAADVGFRRGTILVDAVWGAVGWLAAFPFVVMASLASSRIFQGYETPTNPAISEFATVHSVWMRVLLFAIAVLYAPLSEETMFRGVFLRALTPRVGLWAAIVLASGVFALLHPQLPLGFASIFVLGMLFSLLYQARGSLVAPMVAHGLNNGTIILTLTIMLAN